MIAKSLERIATAAALIVAASSLATAASLDDEIGAILSKHPKIAFSICVESTSGQRVYAHDANKALVPASNMKLLTTAAALSRLGGSFEHATRVALAGPLEAGVLRGNLLVVGGGDPTISVRFDSKPLLGDVAEAVASKGVVSVQGDLVADTRAFDSVRLHPGWETSDAEHWYGAEISALSLNDGCVDVAVGGGASAPSVRLVPDTRYVTIDVRAKLLARPKGHVFSLSRTGANKRTIRLSGKIYRKAKPYTKSIPVTEPGLFFATVLRERLAARGVTVTGAVRLARKDELAAGDVVWERRAPLARTLKVTNQRSLNLYAECLLKTLGRLGPRNQLEPGGSWKRGAKVVRDAALAVGAKRKEVTVDDGSGLSRGNELSARAITTVLNGALAAETGKTFYESLAGPGLDGTLKRRLKRLPPGVTLRGKTGTLTGVSALSGVLDGPAKKRWVFSILSNGPGASRRTLDAIATVIAGHFAR